MARPPDLPILEVDLLPDGPAQARARQANSGSPEQRALGRIAHALERCATALETIVERDGDGDSDGGGGERLW